MLSADKIAAAMKVQNALQEAESAHKGSRHLVVLHGRLAELLDSFKQDLTPSEFKTLGGGTPKTEEGS